MCHPPLSQEADYFQIFVDSGSWTHVIDLELIRGVESRIPEYTSIKPPMEVRAAWDNVLRSTAQAILLVVVRGADDVLRSVILPIVKALGLKQNIFPTSIAAQNSVKTIIEKSGLSLDLGPSSVQLARLYNTDHLDLKIGKTNMRAEAALCVFFSIVW